MTKKKTNLVPASPLQAMSRRARAAYLKGRKRLASWRPGRPLPNKTAAGKDEGAR